MPLDVVMLGRPGAGKGTQARRIEGHFGIPQIGTGDMLRAAIAEGSDLGGRVKAIVDGGDLVPDDLMVELIRARLADGTGAGFVLDGFPRTLDQAEALDRMLGEIGRAISVALDFQLAQGVAEERLLGRAALEGRSDDTPDVIRRRFDTFRRQTAQVSEHYRARGILVGIHADRSVDEVWAEVCEALEQAGGRSDS